MIGIINDSLKIFPPNQKTKVRNQSEEFIVLTECNSYNVIVVLLTLYCWVSFIILLELEKNEGDSSVRYELTQHTCSLSTL